MIDTLYQTEIDKNLNDQVQRPGALLPVQEQPSTFRGFWRGLGGIPGGAAYGFGSAADVAQGTSRVEAAQGMLYNPATRSYMPLPLDDASRADAAKIKAGHIADLFTSEAGDTLRAVGKDYMPDAQTTGAAGQILGQGLSFMTQAVPAVAVGGPVLGPGMIGAAAGMQEADRLREQGVDQQTRMEAGGVTAVGTAAAMALPLSGASALVRFGKGAAGGVASTVIQSEAEKLVLEHAGYDKIASTIDPFDPVNLAINALVPGVMGAALGHTAAGKLREPNAADLSLTPAEQAHSDAVEASTVDVDIAAVKKELASQKDEGTRQVLQAELDKLQAKKQAGGVQAAMAADPNLEAAARVKQTADAMDSSRLTADDDMVGREMHQQALETASDQIARGEPVDVSAVFGEQLGPARESRALADRIDALENQRAQLLGDAGNALGPGEVSDLRAQVAHLESQVIDAGPAAVKARAKELQGQDVSFKQASAQAQRELSSKLADQQATIDRLQQRLDQHAAAAQATERIGHVERDLAAAREQQAALPGPATTPRRLAVALADAYREMGRAPAPERVRANPEAFHTARAEAEAVKTGEAKAPETKPAAPAPSGPRETSPRAAAAEGPDDAHLDAAVAALDPDMMVHMDGMPHAVKLADLMEQLRTEAAEQKRDSRLLEVAAQCALSFPPAP